MKFDRICDLTLEMARVPKSVQFGKVKIDTSIRASADKMANIKMYLLDQFDDEGKAAAINYVIDALTDMSFNGYEDLYQFVLDKTGEAIEAQDGKRNSTKLKYTTRIVFNMLGPSRLGVIKPASDASSPSGAKTSNVRTGVYVINNDNFLAYGLDELQGYHPAILEQLIVFFEEHDKEVFPDMKLRLAIAESVKESLSGIEERLQDKIMQSLKRDDMAGLIIKLRSTKSIHAEGEEVKNDDDMAPVLDVDEEEDYLGHDDVGQLTGGFGPRDDSMNDY